MSRGKDGDRPATPRKPPKPRPPPVEPLTDAEREAKAGDALRKAAVHLTEAEARALLEAWTAHWDARSRRSGPPRPNRG